MKALSLTEECKQKEWHMIQQIAYTYLIPPQWFHRFNGERKEKKQQQQQQQQL